MYIELMLSSTGDQLRIVHNITYIRCDCVNIDCLHFLQPRATIIIIITVGAFARAPSQRHQPHFTILRTAGMYAYDRPANAKRYARTYTYLTAGVRTT